MQSQYHSMMDPQMQQKYTNVFQTAMTIVP
jgi:hypothetical protein